MSWTYPHPRDAIVSLMDPFGLPREIRIGCMSDESERVIRNHVRKHWPGMEILGVRFEERESKATTEGRG